MWTGVKTLLRKKKQKKKTERIKENDKLYKGSDVLMYFN